MRRAATLLAVVAVAGCGGGGDDDAEDIKAIDAVIARLSTESDGAKLCDEVFTAQLVERLYRSRAACVRENSDLTESDTAIKGRDHEIDGDAARTTVSLELPVEGRQVRIGGTVELTRADDSWKVADLGIDLLRDLVVKASVAGLAAGVTKQQFRDAEQVSAEISACTRRRLAKVGDATMRRYGYAAFGEREDDIEGLKQEFYSCMESGPASRAALRQKFEEGVVEGARKRGIPASQAECVVARLKKTAPDAVIAADSVRSIKTGAGLSARLQRLFNEARQRC